MLDWLVFVIFLDCSWYELLILYTFTVGAILRSLLLYLGFEVSTGLLQGRFRMPYSLSIAMSISSQYCNISVLGLALYNSFIKSLIQDKAASFNMILGILILCGKNVTMLAIHFTNIFCTWTL